MILVFLFGKFCVSKVVSWFPSFQMLALLSVVLELQGFLCEYAS